MFIDLLLGIIGPIIGAVTLRLLGFSRTTIAQRSLILSLASLTFVFYIIFGIADFGLRVGSPLDLWFFEISYGVSETILLGLTVVLPILLGLILTIKLKKFGLKKMILLPLLLVMSVGAINCFQTYREFRQHPWEDDLYEYDYCLMPDCPGDLRRY